MQLIGSDGDDEPMEVERSAFGDEIGMPAAEPVTGMAAAIVAEPAPQADAASADAPTVVAGRQEDLPPPVAVDETETAATMEPAPEAVSVAESRETETVTEPQETEMAPMPAASASHEGAVETETVPEPHPAAEAAPAETRPRRSGWWNIGSR
jgi:ribonuclease E